MLFSIQSLGKGPVTYIEDPGQARREITPSLLPSWGHAVLELSRGLDRAA
jgi:hypothetical protein